MSCARAWNWAAKPCEGPASSEVSNDAKVLSWLAMRASFISGRVSA